MVHEYILSGSTVIAEKWTENYLEHMLVYVYDDNGSPIALQYRNTRYLEGEYDVFFFEKNLFGDIIGIYNELGHQIGQYKYNAWGEFSALCMSTNTALESSIVTSYNPFRYRGYFYDVDLGFYYLQSRYYSPELGRFINSDSAEIISASPNALTDKNLFAYCDNNPVMRTDEEGEFWLTSILVGLATQYIGDIAENLMDGKTGGDIFKPTSSIGEYVAAGVTALIPGAGLGGALIRNTVAEGIVLLEDAISGSEVNIADSMLNIGLGTVLDFGAEKVSNKVTDMINSKMPRNYSTYAHEAKKSNPNLTRAQIEGNMQRSISRTHAFSKIASGGIDFLRGLLPY